MMYHRKVLQQAVVMVQSLYSQLLRRIIARMVQLMVVHHMRQLLRRQGIKRHRRL